MGESHIRRLGASGLMISSLPEYLLLKGGTLVDQRTYFVYLLHVYLRPVCACLRAQKAQELTKAISQVAEATRRAEDQESKTAAALRANDGIQAR